MARETANQLSVIEPGRPEEQVLTSSGPVVSSAEVHGASAFLTPQGHHALHNKPKSLEDFEELRRSFSTKDVVEKSVPLLKGSDRFEAIKFLPAYHPMTVAQNPGELSREDEYTGRIADIGTRFKVDDGYASSSSQHVTAMDSDWTKGSVWMRAEIRKAQANGDYTVLAGRDDKGLRSLTAIFIADVDMPHPYAGRGGDYRYLREWKLGGVVSSSDVNPINGFVDTRDQFDGMVNGMLSDKLTLENERDEFWKNIPGRNDETRLNILRESMEGFGHFFIDLHHNAQAGSDAYAKQLKHEADFDKLWDKRLEIVNAQNSDVADLMNTYRELVRKDPYKLRLPAKASREHMTVRRFESNYRAINGRNMPKNVALKLMRRRANIDNEYIESFTMAMQLGKLATTLKSDGSKAVSPVRAMFNGFDNFDYHWANMLGFITTGERVRQSQMYAANYAQPAARQMRFHATHTPGNKLWFSRRKESLFQFDPQDDEVGGMSYIRGQDMDYQSEFGATAADYVNSLYDPAKPMTMPGIIGRFSIVGPRMNRKRVDGILIDCLEAPAIVMRNIVERGLLDTGANTVENAEAPYLQSIFSDPWLDERPHEIIVGKRDSDDFEIEASIGERESISIVRTQLADETADLKLIDNELKAPKKGKSIFTTKEHQLAKNQAVVTSVSIVNGQPHMGRKGCSDADVLLMASLTPPPAPKRASRTYDAAEVEDNL